jgi:uncharacterized protein (DUF2141 family)
MKNELLLYFSAALVSLPCISAVAQTTVTVEVETPAGPGQMIISLCTKETFLKDNCPVQRVVPITVPITTAELTTPSIGSFAVFVVHDLNSNGKLDKSTFGFPNEPLGFSRNPARPRFGPPKFEDVAFDAPDAGRLQFRVKLMKPD